jgi:hypothetical protein
MLIPPLDLRLTFNFARRARLMVDKPRVAERSSEFMAVDLEYGFCLFEYRNIFIRKNPLCRNPRLLPDIPFYPLS